MPLIAQQHNPYRDAVKAMPPVPEPQGGHVFNLLQRGAKAVFPEYYRTLVRLLGEEYSQFKEPTRAMLADLIPDEPEMAALDLMPGGEMLGAGAVKIGNLVDPKAFVLRISQNPRHDIGIMEKLLKGPTAFRGRHTEMPSSIITPGFLNQYLSDPGFLFNATKPHHIERMYTTDVRSMPDDISPIDTYKAYTAKHKTYNKMRGLGEDFNPIEISEYKKGRYKKAYETLRQLTGPPNIRLRTIPEEWEHYRFNPYEENMDDFYRKQLENITSYRNLTKKGIPPLHFNEVIYNYYGEPDQLAGVKINSLAKDSYAKEHQQALIDFAQGHNLPIFDWPDIDSYVAAKRGLGNPYAGNWIKTPEGTYTSSEVDRLTKGLTNRGGRFDDPDIPEAKIYSKSGKHVVGVDYQKLLELLD